MKGGAFAAFSDLAYTNSLNNENNNKIIISG